MLSRKKRARLSRSVGIAFLSILMVTAAGMLLRGRLDYGATWGGPVFPGFVLALATVLLVGIEIRHRRALTRDRKYRRRFG